MKKIIKIILLAVLGLTIVGCSKVSDEVMLQSEIALENGAIFVDVRSKEEYKDKHIEGSINIPISSIHDMYTSLPKDKEIIVYCRTGTRSSIVADFLREKGRMVFDIKTQDNMRAALNPNKFVNKNIPKSDK